MRQELTLVLVLASVPALARPQAGPTPAELVEQLAIPGQRAKAREQLSALGKEAVPSLAERLPAANQILLPELLALLVDLGPDAGAAVPQVCAAYSFADKDNLVPLLWALAELAPYRAPDVEVEPALTQARATVQTRLASGSRTDFGLAQQRLRRRLEFPRAPDLDTLLAIVQGYQPYRVELACEHLGQRGAAARDALPFLRTLLERAEPRILTTERTVPIHRKAARAVLAIAPDGETAELARAVLAGRTPVTSVTTTVPDRARDRIAELVGDLDAPDQRAAAAANLVAMGKLAAPAVAATLLLDHDVASREAALGVLRDLGPLAAVTVPQLVDAVTTFSTEHTISVLRALQATAPWCRDVVPDLLSSMSTSSVVLLDHRIPGEVNVAFLNSFHAAHQDYAAAMSVDPSSSVPELGILLEGPIVATRERALVVVRERGAACRPLVPTLAAMLEAQQPKTGRVVWNQDGSVSTGRVDRSEFVQRLAAQAIIAVAASDDPLVAKARTVLARPEPK